MNKSFISLVGDVSNDLTVCYMTTTITNTKKLNILVGAINYLVLNCCL